MRKIIYALAIVLVALGQASAQDQPKHISGSYSDIPDNASQTKPAFPGGISAFNQYIIDNFKPDGKVRGVHQMRITFVVERDGSISNVTILKGLDDKNNERLTEVIRNGPKWTPGYIDGKPTRAQFNLPLTIKFK